MARAVPAEKCARSRNTVNARIAGVREALVLTRLPCDSNWVREGDPKDLKFLRSLVSGRLAEPTLPAQSIILTPTLVVRESCGSYL
jgi:DNA-binding LacI/PurR family transcriptional regulator